MGTLSKHADDVVERVFKLVTKSGDDIHLKLKNTGGKVDEALVASRNLDAKLSAEAPKPKPVSKNPDNWTPGTWSDKELAEKLRPHTPDQARRDAVQGPSGADGLQADPLYPNEKSLRVRRLEADHIIPLRRIVAMPGFRSLSRQDMIDVAKSSRKLLGPVEAGQCLEGCASSGGVGGP